MGKQPFETPENRERSIKWKLRLLVIGQLVASIVVGVPLFFVLISMQTAVPRNELRQEDLVVPIESVPASWKNVVISKGKAFEWPYPTAKESPFQFSIVVAGLIVVVVSAIMLRTREKKLRASLLLKS